MATGETDPAAIAALGSARLHATAEQLCDALGAATDLHPVYRRLLAMTLAELEVIESHMQQLDEELAALLRVHQDAVQRLARCLVSVSIRRSRSSRRSARRRGPFRRPSIWRPGWAPAPAMTRVPASITVTDPQAGTAKCVVCSIRARTLR